MRKLVFGSFLILAATAASVARAAPPDDPPPEVACHFGAWRLDDGGRLTIESSDGPNLRWRSRDGGAGKLFATGEGRYEGGDGWSVRDPVTVRARFGDCGDDSFTFARGGQPAQTAHRAPLPVAPITFASGSERLYGELVLPAQGVPKAIAVLQYGSGLDSAVLNNFVQYMLPLDGIAVFVFDKRGTGRSTGQPTADFRLLAADMAAAVDAVRRRPEAAGVPLGLMGESQGGWVAPLAATMRKVDFVVASYSLAVSPEAEDRDEVAQSVDAFGPAAVDGAEALHRAATRVAVSRFAEGLDELERLKARYRGEPWFAKVGGDYTGPLVATPAAEMGKLRAVFDAYLAGIDLNYAPEPVLKRLDVPTLFVLAGEDTEAPHEATLAVLQGLQKGGAPIDVAVFPHADHAMIAVSGPLEDHTRLGRMAPGYFDLLADWIKARRFVSSYGAAELTPRR